MWILKIKLWPCLQMNSVWWWWWNFGSVEHNIMQNNPLHCREHYMDIKKCLLKRFKIYKTLGNKMLGVKRVIAWLAWLHQGSYYIIIEGKLELIMAKVCVDSTIVCVVRTIIHDKWGKWSRGVDRILRYFRRMTC